MNERIFEWKHVCSILMYVCIYACMHVCYTTLNNRRLATVAAKFQPFIRTSHNFKFMSLCNSQSPSWRPAASAAHNHNWTNWWVQPVTLAPPLRMGLCLKETAFQCSPDTQTYLLYNHPYIISCAAYSSEHTGLICWIEYSILVSMHITTHKIKRVASFYFSV